MNGAPLSGCVILRTSNGYIVQPTIGGQPGTLADAQVLRSLGEVNEWLADHLPLAPIGPVRGGGK